MKKILINALGIQDSGGITVLDKMLQECIIEAKYNYYVFVNNCPNITHLVKKFIRNENLNFIEFDNKGILHRLYLENLLFRSFIVENKVSLVYNFSGSYQFMLKIPSLVKVQNLMFYSKKLDEAYKRNSAYILWLKQIWLKRIIFLSMLNRSQNIEIQSGHVKKALSDFIDVANKKFYLKNDFSVNQNIFSRPKNYNFQKKITFIYIVGPHFRFLHKNIQDFVKAMSLLKKIGKDFEIKVTLSFEELNNSPLWEKSLSDKTIFLGYQKDKNEIQKLFQDNTVLVSTSIIETLGLHIIEGIQNGVVCIAPNEPYSRAVYGDGMCTYKLFDSESLSKTILKIYDFSESDIQKKIQKNQEYVMKNEASKFYSIVDIFDAILKKEEKNVQK